MYDMHQHFYVRPGRLSKAFSLILFLLILANLLIDFRYQHSTGEIRGWLRVFSLDGERNLPTAFNVFLLLINSVLLLLIAAQRAAAKRLESISWLVLSAGFVFMGMDEAWTIHEDLIGPIRQQLGNKHLGLLYNAWIIPGFAIVALVGLIYMRFLASLPRSTRVGFILAGFIYIAGALGIEALDGKYLEAHGNDFIYKLSTILEEGLEMSGLILFNYYLLLYISKQFGSVRLTFTGKTVSQMQAAPSASPEAIPMKPSRVPLPPLLPVAQQASQQKRG
jgi:hypothetical protein